MVPQGLASERKKEERKRAWLLRNITIILNFEFDGSYLGAGTSSGSVTTD